jgi:23S rRNA (adenine2503-C2)-methyltransferase
VATVYDLSLGELTDRLTAWGEPAFRAKQVHRQLWQRAATYDRMPDVPTRLRERLQAELPMQVEVLEEREADGGATRKALLRIGERHVIETVLMGYRDRVTVCVSTQSGCAMGCGLCAACPTSSSWGWASRWRTNATRSAHSNVSRCGWGWAIGT